jgi:hypothetical protein
MADARPSGMSTKKSNDARGEDELAQGQSGYASGRDPVRGEHWTDRTELEADREGASDEEAVEESKTDVAVKGGDVKNRA